ncbi:WD40/YVTN/BNR-like repeat-containing protein [Streptomyces meridianus]|uniref:Exo-alpha-sialidase n=1 Tax=Streptomyces meridianus TaxID=2938945 RepID=A0ABT0XBC1_9ACTN|nr:sialidase family protein [Streptomyces meridianus]MCM2579819.1 exo-alpha-sialidase [Streptomyces meridianus]
MTGVLLAVGTRKGLFVGRRRGGGWEFEGPHFTAQAVYSIGIDTRRSTPRLLVGADSSHWGPSVFHSDDLGANWHEPKQPAVKFPPGTGASLERVWQLHPAGPAAPDVVYAGTQPGALFRSEDGGRSFELVRALWDHPTREQWAAGFGGQAVHTVITDPRSADAVTVAVSTGGVYRSLDGGASWSPSNTGIQAVFLPDRYPEFGQCVHKIAQDPVNPDRLYLQNHWGVYRSDDAGDTWTSIGDALPSDFGFAVAAHPRRPDTAYLFPIQADADRVPAGHRCRVYRTDDAGGKWRELGSGLPEGRHYGTVLRDALCVDDGDPAGVYFGNRNGELYASPDEGESWELIGSHLPDVLCVRAAVVG